MASRVIRIVKAHTTDPQAAMRTLEVEEAAAVIVEASSEVKIEAITVVIEAVATVDTKGAS